MKTEKDNKYTSPKAEIIKIGNNDVITSSGEWTETGVPWQDSWDEWNAD